VLINLFHKPATIVYLTFIGVCIIGTFFFIKFVEKNVENEDDVAIGVSSERVLQKEGRLYRQSISMSSLSLAAKEQHESLPRTTAATSAIEGATSEELDSDENNRSLGAPFGSKSNRSSRTSTSLKNGVSLLPTAVEAGSSAVGQQGSHLKFADSVSPPRISESKAEQERTGANVSRRSSQSTRRNRRRDHSNRHDDGTPLSIWERMKRIEVIPSLPDDKLIRRSSPLLRFCLPLSYAALGGMMASYTVLFAKSLINLLVTSIFEGDNQFTSFIAWVILIVTVVTAVSQVYWINMGLKKYDAMLQVPVFFTIWVLLDIVGGGIYYDEFRGFTVEKYVLFCVGVLTVFFGVALLAKRLALLAKEDVGDSSPPQSQAASRRPSMKNEASLQRGV
jgi:hypothetical protein